MINIYSKVLDNIIYLYEGYSKEHRNSTQPFHLEKVKKAVKGYEYNCNDLLIREPLIEHVGSLPIVATAIYPYLNDKSVDLGKALTMLAIHDIGELVVGDEMTFTKDKSSGDKEKQAALKLLPEFYHKMYLEMEERKTNTGKFAKAVDKITPDILDLILPAELMAERYEKQVGGELGPVMLLKKFKYKFMTWNEFMTGLHLEILRRLGKE